MSEMNTSDAPRFEVRYMPTRQLLQEAYTATQPIYLIVVGLLTLGMLGLGVSYIVHRRQILLGVLQLAFGAAYGVYFLSRPALLARKRIKEYQEVYGSATAS